MGVGSGAVTKPLLPELVCKIQRKPKDGMFAAAPLKKMG